jgi:hypothetical protein
MKTRTRRAAAVAGIAILVASAGSGTLAAQGQAKQQITHDAVILVSATSPAHDARREHRTTHRSTNRPAEKTKGQNRTAEIEVVQNASPQDGTAEVGVEAGVEAAADAGASGQSVGQSPNGAGLEVVLKSLPGLESDGDSCS